MAKETKTKSKRKTSLQWLGENGYGETVTDIRALEEYFKKHKEETGKRIQRSWKRMLLGTRAGKPCKMTLNGRKVEFPVLKDNESYIKEVFGEGADIDDILKPKKRAGKSSEEKKAQAEERKAARDKIKAKRKAKGKKSKRAKKVESTEEAATVEEPVAEVVTEAPPAEAPAKEEKAKKKGKKKLPKMPKLGKNALKKSKRAKKAEPEEAEEVDEPEEEPEEEPAAAEPEPEPEPEKPKKKVTVLRAINDSWQTEADLVAVTGQPLRLLKSQLGLLETRGVAKQRKGKDGTIQWRKLKK